ncbi:ATPase family AAA domain-containing protein 2-like [Neodiprion fabricii]|uniref:ATPase family AAA domain-containing protein 2-like n=1 Tax=Neodiprion fabricii TaxID=2872261 RepID=UPI001ED8FD2C|nr:ATPase family AAA domain-containing protein 2-like [Neodiprion fabricii]
MAKEKDFSCVGGLEKHIQILKETVLFPLMYGDVYAKFNLRPPRGLLFYGPPGTGKTLVAGALATECSSSERKVSFISRKGSDCLSKWVGESEKKLQQIFHSAYQSRPCIIFFDEVDGLAPIRSSHQDYVHASVVSTLLALMDGLDSNSEVIVIGSTNRLDAIDPALRRPGRFDKELYFPLPSYNARKEILAVHIESWKQKPSQKFLAYLAAKTVGFCGSDLQAICAEAVMCCVRRTYPQIYTSKSKYQINERSLKIEKQDFLKAQQNIVPASQRAAITPIKRLSRRIQPLLENTLTKIMFRLENLCPPDMLSSDVITGRAMSRSSNCPRLLLTGLDDSHTRYLGPAILHALEHLPCHVLDITTLFEVTGRAAEEAIIQRVKEARRSLPSLLYVPEILAWWNLVDEPARVVFTSLMSGLDSSVSMLVLTTATCTPSTLPNEIKSIYEYQGEVFEVKTPGPSERQGFFEQLYNQVNSGVCGASHKSSSSIIEILKPKRIKSRKTPCTIQSVHSTAEGKPDVIEIAPPKKLRPEAKSRKKINTVQSFHSTLPVKTGAMKREFNAGTEGSPSKRQKLIGSVDTDPRNKNEPKRLTDGQISELLRKTVSITRGWTTHQLETLFSALEGHSEKQDKDMFLAFNECLSIFQETEKLKARLKES